MDPRGGTSEVEISSFINYRGNIIAVHDLPSDGRYNLLIPGENSPRIINASRDSLSRNLDSVPKIETGQFYIIEDHSGGNE